MAIDITMNMNMSNNLTEQNENALDATAQSNGQPVMVSYADSITETTLQVKPLYEILDTIRSGEGIKGHIRTIRLCAYAERRRQLKQQYLPYFNCGSFKDNNRKDSNFIQTQHLLLDCDHIMDHIDELKEQLKQDPDVFAVFLSPSGDGLKIIYTLDKPVIDASMFRTLYGQMSAAFKDKYGITVDNTADPSRACYLSHDPDIYVNQNAEPVTTEMSTADQEAANDQFGKKEKILKSLSGTTPGNRTHSVTQIAGMFLNHGLSEDYTLQFVKAWNKQNAERLTDGKVEYTVRDIYDRYGQNGPLSNYWSYGTEILEIGIIDNKFYMENNPKEKVYIRAGAFTNEEKNKTYSHLVTAKHIPHLARINFQGDVALEQSEYSYDAERAELDVRYSALAANVEDNQFIEDYLERVFGEHKTFIKEWLAVYCYTNYKKLPFLILTGKRGSSKNTFAESVAEIFPTISTFWHGEERNFNDEVEMKLLIADETVSDNPKQYKMLKQHSGQKDVIINKKYLKPYKVHNNMNIIILSNAKTPISVERDEIPTSKENNQFFVLNLEPVIGVIDSDMGKKIVARLGHYIRTELKTVYNSLDTTGNRYTIKVPITEAERALFVNNITDVDQATDDYVRKMADEYDLGYPDNFYQFVDAGFVITDFFDRNPMPYGIKKAQLVKNFVNRGYFVSVEYERKTVNKKRAYAYAMTAELQGKIREQKTPNTQPADPAQLDLPIMPTSCLQKSESMGTVSSIAA